MPRWERTELPEGHVRHEMNGRLAGVRVDAMPEEKATLITVVQLVMGTDEATVERCKRRAEELFAAANGGRTR